MFEEIEVGIKINEVKLKALDTFFNLTNCNLDENEKIDYEKIIREILDDTKKLQDLFNNKMKNIIDISKDNIK